MKIVTVMPIARGVFTEELTYFTNQDAVPGLIASIPVKKRVIEALITEVRQTVDVKAELKKADFPLKKILRIKKNHLFSPQFIRTCRRAAEYYACPVGQVLKQLVPMEILKSSIGSPRKNFGKTGVKEKYAIQEPKEERMTYYRGLVRGEFSRKMSVLLCVPSSANALYAQSILGKGIEKYTFVIHGGLTGKQLKEEWKKVINTDHPVLIITTPMGLSIPRTDIKTIVVDEEGSDAYKALSRPFIDYRILAEFFAEEIGGNFFISGTVLRTETVYRLKQGILKSHSRLKHHTLSGAKIDLVRLNQEANRGNFQILSDELIGLIIRSYELGEKFFLFVHRRGLEPIVACQDCGSILTCENCQTPLSLHRETTAKGEENFLLCHRCNHRLGADKLCKNCGGWRLIGLGIGLDLVARELLKALPATIAGHPAFKIFKLDSDYVKTPKQAISLLENFANTAGPILIGTEMALRYFRGKVENLAIVAIDSMFALPNYRINEKIFTVLTELRELATRRFLIQTRNLKTDLFDYALRGSLGEFQNQELSERKEYSYPPFRLFIKISLRGKATEVLPEMKMLEKKLAGYEFDVFPTTLGIPPKERKINILLRLRAPGENQAIKWPQEELVSILKSLPPKFIVDIDPINLF